MVTGYSLNKFDLFNSDELSRVIRHLFFIILKHMLSNSVPLKRKEQVYSKDWGDRIEYYTIIDLCWGGHGVYLNSTRHTPEINMIKFTIQ